MFWIVLTTLIKWVLRRVLEMGGSVIAVASFFIGIITMLPPQYQTAIWTAIQTRSLESLSVPTFIGLIGAVIGLVWNYRSTFSKTPTITAGTARVPVDQLPTLTQAEVLATVEAQTGKRPEIVSKADALKP